ncbi:MAG: hypothetical protein FWD74_03355 [Actinomycetia bacterium]|nr:hypothetical protein [Actinomycetes bacterium]
MTDPYPPVGQVRPVDGDKPISAATMDQSVASWSIGFTDAVKGFDIRDWQKRAVKTLAPALLGGQAHRGVTVDAVVARDDAVRLTFPVFIDDDPTPASQAGGKVKFNGKAQLGMIAITRRLLAFAHLRRGPLLTAGGWDLGHVRALNALEFKISRLSISSAGPGYEALGQGPDGEPARLVFRVALVPAGGEGKFTPRLRAALGLSTG